MTEAVLSSRASTVGSALAENFAALIAQSAMALMGFLDAYFMAMLGVGALACASYVAGFVILVNAAFAGSLQAFLIVGGPHLGRGDKPAFVQSARAATRAALLLAACAHLIVVALIGVLSLVSPAAPHGALRLAVLLTPTILLNAACLVFRMKAMLLKAQGVLVSMALVLVGAKLGALALLFRFRSFVDADPVALLAASGFIAGLVCLCASWIVDRWRFRAINRHSPNRAAIAALMKRIVLVGAPIGAVIVLEMSVLGMGQMIETLLGTRFGASFGLVIQFVLLAQTVAVALGQVTTINVAMARGTHDRAALRRAACVGVASTAALHGAIAAIVIAYPGAVAALVTPHRIAESAALGHTVAGYLIFGALCQFLLAMVVCLASILRGMDDLGHPLLTIAVNYLVLGVASSAAMAWLTPLADIGVWIGVGLSLSSSMAFLSFRVIGNLRQKEQLT